VEKEKNQAKGERRIMKRFISLLLFSLIIILINPFFCFAKIKEVVVFPSGAKVIEEEKVDPLWDGNLGKIVFYLPSFAVPDSFSLTFLNAKGIWINSITFQKVEGLINERIKKIKAKIDEINEKEHLINSELKATEDFIKIWENLLKAELKSSLNLKKGVSFLKRLKDLYYKRQSLIKKLKECKSLKNRLEDQLNASTLGENSHLEVIVFVYSKVKDKGLRVRYSYFIKRGISIEPVYILKAYPKKGVIKLEWKSEISQATSIDWKDAFLTFSTIKPSFKLKPYPLESWIIYATEFTESKESFFMEKMMGTASLSFKEAKKERRTEFFKKPVSFQKKYMFDMYKLGRFSILSGEKKIVSVKNFTFYGKFKYLVRPLEEEKAYLYAEVETRRGLRIPSGRAFFWIDDNYVGKKSLFSIFSKKFKVYFGEDPEIKIKTVLLEMGSGRKGIINNKKTYKWLWKVVVENKKERPVQLEMEFPYPQVRDERIKLELLGNKELFVKKDHTLKCDLFLKKGEKREILFGAKIVYPKKLNVWFE